MVNRPQRALLPGVDGGQVLTWQWPFFQVESVEWRDSAYSICKIFAQMWLNEPKLLSNNLFSAFLLRKPSIVSIIIPRG